MNINFVKKINKNKIKKYAMFIALIIITLFFQVTTQGIILKPMNVSKMILQNSYILILAIGMLPVILTGNIDLSVGSIMAFIGAVTGVLIIKLGYPIWLTIILCLVLGLMIGIWHGFWIAYIEIPSFIVTLAGMLIFRGLTLVILKGNTIAPYPEKFRLISAGYFPENSEYYLLSSLIIGSLFAALYLLKNLMNRKEIKERNKSSKILYINILFSFIIIFSFYWVGSYKGIPIILFLLLVLTIIYNFITKNTIIGRSIYAYGGNEKAARLSGINTKRTLFITYANMGLMAALAGIIFSGRLNAATPSAGTGFELDAIAACYIGGASASGGTGTIVGAIIGGLVMGVLNNGMSIMGIGIDWQQAIKGLVLLAAVAFDTYNNKNTGL